MMKSLLLILIIATTSLAQDANKQLSEIISGVENQLTSLKVSDDLKQQCSNDIADARANLKLGNSYLTLYTIRTCQLELASLAYAEAKSDLSTKGSEAFAAEWQQLVNTL